MDLTRHLTNPILSPNSNHPWESFAAFNGTVVKIKNRYILLYRAMGNEMSYRDKRMRLSVIGKAEGSDGVRFSRRSVFIEPSSAWDAYGCEDPRITFIDNTYVIFYTALSQYPPNAESIKPAVVLSRDMKTIDQRHVVTPFNAKAMTMFPEKINGRYTVLFTLHSDRPPSSIGIAQFDRLEYLWNQSFWRHWYEHERDHVLPLRRVNSDHVEVGAPPVKTDDGWLLIYSYIKHYLSASLQKEFRIEGVLLDAKNPSHIVGRAETPLLKPETGYEMKGQTPNIVFPEGALLENDALRVYYGGADTCCALASARWSALRKTFETNAPSVIKGKKFPNNPLLEPVSDHPWENTGVCNAGAVALHNTTYLLYRAFTNNRSRIGLAISHDGLYIDERLPEPIYPLRCRFEKPQKDELGGGTEDPRITKFGDMLYMCYTAYDGVLPRLAFTSISVEEFLARRWNAWEKPKIISPPGIMDKDGALFPEKIHGMYVFLHRIEPNIVIDTVSDLTFSQKKFLGNTLSIRPRMGFWDGVKIGLNGPPIKTDRGWLVFYHGISKIDRHYRIGALVLDLHDITNIIGRTYYPILEPELPYEREGIVNNVVFSCGQVTRERDVYIYYGGADKVLCGATINIDELVDYCIRSNNKKYLQ